MAVERAVTEADINAACERVMRDFLASQVRELDLMGMGHIPYAVNARRCLDAFDLHLFGGEAPARREGDRPRLRLVDSPPA